MLGPLSLLGMSFTAVIPILVWIWLLVLVGRFVRAFERIAAAAESVAQARKE